MLVDVVEVTVVVKCSTMPSDGCVLPMTVIPALVPMASYTLSLMIVVIVPSEVPIIDSKAPIPVLLSLLFAGTMKV